MLAATEREAAPAEADTKDELGHKTKKEFCKMPKEDLLAAKLFTHQFRNEKVDSVAWKTHSVNDKVSDCKVFSALGKKRDQGTTIGGDLDFDKTNADFFLSHASATQQ